MANLHLKLSFLDLPREIRDQIYGYCSARPVDLERYWPPRYNAKPPPLGPMSLLRVCKKVHTEAASIFYGKNLHIFYIGWSSFSAEYDLKSGSRTYVAPQYLSMIKSCVLFVSPSMCGSSSEIKGTFLRLKASVQAFADRLSGGHSLKELQIVYSNSGDRNFHPLFIPTPMPTSDPGHNLDQWTFNTDMRLYILEPLTDIYGVPRVSVSGVCPEYAYRLERAMSCSQKAVSPYPETYRTRMVRVKDRGSRRWIEKPQAYRVSKYYESKIVWNETLLAPLPPPLKLKLYKPVFRA